MGTNNPYQQQHHYSQMDIAGVKPAIANFYYPGSVYTHGHHHGLGSGILANVGGGRASGYGLKLGSGLGSLGAASSGYTGYGGTGALHPQSGYGTTGYGGHSNGVRYAAADGSGGYDYHAPAPPPQQPAHPHPHPAPAPVQGHSTSDLLKSKGSSAMTALTLLSFFFFLNLLQSCLKEHMDAANPTVMVMTATVARNRLNKMSEMNSRETSIPDDTNTSNTKDNSDQFTMESHNNNEYYNQHSHYPDRDSMSGKTFYEYKNQTVNGGYMKHKKFYNNHFSDDDMQTYEYNSRFNY